MESSEIIENNTIYPNPALVLALGKDAATIVAEVKTLYLQKDTRKNEISRFLALMRITPENTEAFDGEVMETVSSYAEEKPQSQYRIVEVAKAQSDSWQDLTDLRLGYDELCKDGLPIKTELQSIIESLRSHATLVRTRYGREDAPPFNVIVLADLWSITDNAALLPTAYMLLDLLHGLHGVMVHFLIMAATFPREIRSDEEKARFFAILHDLESTLGKDYAVTSRPFLEALKIDYIRPLPFNFYLFDRQMKGGRRIENREELQIIVGNFVLGLLNQIVSYQLTSRSSADILGTAPLFCSGGAATMSYYPPPLIEWCAFHQAIDYLNADFISEPESNTDLIKNVLAADFKPLGDLKNWAEQILYGLPYKIVAEDQVLRLTYPIDIAFTELDIENARKTNWVSLVTQYDQSFRSDQQVEHLNEVDERLSALINQRKQAHMEVIDHLPQSDQLYPGGLKIAQDVLRDWKVSLTIEQESLKLTSESTLDITTCEANLSSSLQELNKAILSFPNIPWLLRILPKPLKRYFHGIYSVFHLRKQIEHLKNLQNKVIRELESLYVTTIEKRLWTSLSPLLEDLVTEVDEAVNDLEKLSKTFDETVKKLNDLLNGTSIKPTNIREHSEFRQFIADKVFVDEEYKLLHAHVATIHKQLFDAGFLNGWRSLQYGEIKNRLLPQCKIFFEPLNDIEIEDVLVRPMNDVGINKACDALKSISMAASPLADPQFDTTGSQDNQPDLRYLLLTDPKNSVIAGRLEDKLTDWEHVTTSDPYLILAFRAKKRFPLASLETLSSLGSKEYSQLDASKQSRFYFEPLPKDTKA